MKKNLLVLMCLFCLLFFNPYVESAEILPSIEITGSTSGICDNSSGTLNPIIPTFLNVYTNSSATGVISVAGVGVVDSGSEDHPFAMYEPGGYGFSGMSTYNVPAGTPITVTILTYTGPGLTGNLSYVAEIVFNCTTGAITSLQNGPPQGILYMVDPVTPDRILQLNPDTGTIINAFSVPASPSESTGLAYAMGRLFFPTQASSLIYELNQGNGGIINSFAKPTSNTDEGLGFSGSQLYALDNSTETLYVLNPNTGATITSFTFPFNTCGGLTYAGGRNSLFITNCTPDPDTIYEINPTNGSVLNSFSGPAGAEIWGLGYSFTRSTLFLGESQTSIIYEVNPSTGAIINTLSTTTGTPAIAADENGLSATSIPTLTQWGMIIFAILTGLGAMYYLRRQTTKS